MFKEHIAKLSTSQKARYVIVLIYFILNAILLVIAFRMNLDDLRLLVKMATYIPYMRYVASGNVILFIIILVMYYREMRGLRNKEKKAEEELLRIKSKLYDIEEGRKSSADGPSESND